MTEHTTRPGDGTTAERINQLNATIRYTMWSVFRAASPLPAQRDALVSEAEALVASKFATDAWLNRVP